MNVHDMKIITLEAAKKAVNAAEAEARKNGWNVAIAVVDPAGLLVHFSRIEGTQPGSIAIAQGKARTAANFKRPTKMLEEAVAGGRTVFLAVDGMIPMEGGLPISIDGQIVGAIGVSGVLSSQDAQVAQAGIDAIR